MLTDSNGKIISIKNINDMIGQFTDRIDPSSMALIHYHQEDLISELKNQFGMENVEYSIESRKRHGKDLSHHPFLPPDIVVYPTDYSQIQWLVNMSSRHNPPLPLIPFGIGSSLQGQVLAVKNGSITVNMSKLSRMISIHPHDQDITVQAGMTRGRLEEIVNPYNLSLPIDIGVDATIGGMIATGATGPSFSTFSSSLLSYGSISHHLVNLKYINNKGEIVKTGQRAKRSRSGYNLTELMTGSEGTLGIIIEATLRLMPIPPSTILALAVFDDMESACNAACQIFQPSFSNFSSCSTFNFIPISKCELLNKESMEAINMELNTTFKTQPTLFMEFHGISNKTLMNHVYNVSNICHDNGNIAFQFTKDREEQDFLKATINQIWPSIQAIAHKRGKRERMEPIRKNGETILPANFDNINANNGATMIITDIAVPLSRLTGCLKNICCELGQQQLSVPIICHVGDGCIYIFLTVDQEKSPHEFYKLREIDRHLIDCALAAEGSCSSTYGIGMGKMEYIKQELGMTGWNAMYGIKELFDPLNIFNPNKLVQKQE